MIRAVVVAVAAVAAFAAAPAVASAQLIAIDPGHGGSDPGAVGSGMQEKEIVLDVSTRFADLLRDDTADGRGGGQWSVIMTRVGDESVSLAARASFANSMGADRFLSIHANAFSDPSANGTETFSFSEGTTGAALRNLVQEEMIAAWGLRNRGNKTANFAVLRETAMPAELHELGFITNSGDAVKLASDGARQSAAEAHLRALQRHFGLAPYIPGPADEPDDPGEPEEPDQPERPDEPEQPEGPEDPDEPDPGDPEPEDPDSEDPEDPGDPGDPDAPGGNGDTTSGDSSGGATASGGCAVGAAVGGGHPALLMLLVAWAVRRRPGRR